MAKKKLEINYVWTDRKRTFLGLPWSFTKYKLTDDRLMVETGFFNLTQEELRLYRVMDLSLTRTFGQRMFGLGTIIIRSSDKTNPTTELKCIKNSEWVKETLSELVEEERMKKRVSGREIMDSHFDHDDIDDTMDMDNDDDNN